MDKLVGKTCFYNFRRSTEFNNSKDAHCKITGVDILVDDVFGTMTTIVYLDIIDEFEDKFKSFYLSDPENVGFEYDEEYYFDAWNECANGVCSTLIYGIK